MPLPLLDSARFDPRSTLLLLVSIAACSWLFYGFLVSLLSLVHATVSPTQDAWSSRGCVSLA